jgi:hypothetical protein
MKNLIFLFCLLIAGSSFSQTKTASKLGNSAKISKNDSIICSKTWIVTAIEEWGVVSKPSEKTQNDMLYMSLDGKFELVLLGEKKAGTWSRAGQYINFTDLASGQKFNYKIVSVDPAKIKLDFYSEDNGHSIFEMEPKK